VDQDELGHPGEGPSVRARGQVAVAGMALGVQPGQLPDMGGQHRIGPPGGRQDPARYRWALLSWWTGAVTAYGAPRSSMDDAQDPPDNVHSLQHARTGKELADQAMAGMSKEELDAFATAFVSGTLFGGRSFEPPEPDPIVLPVPPAGVSTYRLRLDLDDARPPVWRRLEVRGDLTLDRVHDVIQVAMGWMDSHLHSFRPGPEKLGWPGPRFLNDFDVSEGEEGIHESTVRLDQVLQGKGDRLFYVYDFGDDWAHTLKVEALRPADEDEPSATCLTGRRACPLEDVGGVWSHNELVEALGGGPGAPEVREDYEGWLPADYDPAEFEVGQTNLTLALLDVAPDDLRRLVSEPPGGGPPLGPALLAPALLALIGRTPMPAAVDLAGLTTLAQVEPDEDPEGADGVGSREVDEEAMAAAVRPWQLLLGMAGADGIPLTAAGWMKPAVVEAIFTALDMGEEWIGKGNREDLTYPVAALRESAQELGLLRKHRGALVRTPRGRAVDGDVSAVWDQIATSLPLGRNDFDRDASVLLLLHLAADLPAEDDTWGEIAGALVAAGWRVEDGQPLDSSAALQGAGTTRAVLERAGALGGWRNGLTTTATGRALARRALFPHRSTAGTDNGDGHRDRVSGLPGSRHRRVRPRSRGTGGCGEVNGA
jgi:hypothetical protein